MTADKWPNKKTLLTRNFGNRTELTGWMGFFSALISQGKRRWWGLYWNSFFLFNLFTHSNHTTGWRLTRGSSKTCEAIQPQRNSLSACSRLSHTRASSLSWHWWIPSGVLVPVGRRVKTAIRIDRIKNRTAVNLPFSSMLLAASFGQPRAQKRDVTIDFSHAVGGNSNTQIRMGMSFCAILWKVLLTCSFFKTWE